MFSGAVKIADNFDDFLAPSQNCVKPLIESAKQAKVNSSGGGGSGGGSGLMLDVRDTPEVDMAVSSDKKEKAGNKGKLIKIELDVPEGSGFGQMREDGVKKTATVSLNDCLACSGCVTSAETVLITQQSGEEFLSVIQSNTVGSMSGTNTIQICVVSVSPVVVTSLAVAWSMSEDAATSKLVGFLKSLGVHYVVDASYSLQIAMMEAREEFVSRFNSKTNLPVLTSECPGWICYAEKTQGEFVLPYVSSTKSPQQISGTIIKSFLSKVLNVNAKGIYHATIMPCYDKKLEASRDDFYDAALETRDVDIVLATTEVVEMMTGGEAAKNLTEVREEEKSVGLKCFDTFHHIGQRLSSSSSASTATESSKAPQGKSLFRTAPGSSASGSGGYAEHIFRYAAQQVFNVRIPDADELPWKVGRNSDWREVSLEVEGKAVMTFAIAYGFRNIQNLMRQIKRKKCPFDYVEIMACPSGCLNGGGQLRLGAVDPWLRASGGTDGGGDQDMHIEQVDKGEETKQAGVRESGDIANIATGIKAQKELVSTLYTTFHEREYHPPDACSATDWLYKVILGGHPYSNRAQQMLHTQYHAVEKVTVNPLGIKW